MPLWEVVAIGSTVSTAIGAIAASIVYSRGKWVDHPCRPPIIRGALGDRWQCKCGKIWTLVRQSDDLGNNRWQGKEQRW